MAYKLNFDDGSSAVLSSDAICAKSQNDEEFLSHYGVKGMKWGIRNEETLERYSRDGKGFFNGNLTGGGGYLPEDLVLGNDKEIEENPDMWQMKDVPWDADSDMKAVNIYRDLAMRDLTNVAANQMSIMEMLSGDLSAYEKYGYSGYMVNCATCSMVYDLRRRGFDVDANGTANMSEKMEDIGEYYVGASPKNCDYIEDMESDLNKMPDKSRGVMWGITVNGGGHAIAWEKENGSVVYRDCQSNEKYSSSDIDTLFSVNKKSAGDSPRILKTVSYVRLDNATPNLKRIREEGLVSSNVNSSDNTAKDKARSSIGSDRQKVRDYKKSVDRYTKWMNETSNKKLVENFSEQRDYWQGKLDEAEESLSKKLASSGKD